MTATFLPERSAAPSTRRRLKGPILLATDGQPQSAGAFAAAVCISAGGTRRNGRTDKLPVRVVTICDSLPIMHPEMSAAVPTDFLGGRRTEMLANALAQVRYSVADTSNWRVDVLSGPPAPTIAVLAAELDASLVVMGIGKHDLVDRVFGTETALHLMQLSSVPVLAVPQNWIGIPRTVLIAVDFGPAGLRAAQTAMHIVASGATVCFAHVSATNAMPDHGRRLAENYRNNLDAEFDRFVKAVGVPNDVTVTRTRLFGDSAGALLTWANKNRVDMIVTGTHGVSALARLLVSGVARKLARGAHCAVLVAPAASALAPA